MFLLHQKTAVVTGGGSGIGKEVCIVLAKQGAKVFVVDLSEESAHATVEIIKKEGGEGKSIVIDVTNQKELMAAYAQIDAIHILVNCAGISHIGNATNTEEQDFEKIFNVNVK
ncbi:MAG: SDR family NAD(P)-dependent oxidoreductase, partial [Chitinophagia bacterium]|nr:SDR family NAD(P)-dependent oxidoreductase [Chitinophagia bacterium]